MVKIKAPIITENHAFTDTAWDVPSKQDYIRNPSEEDWLEWIRSKRPTEKLKVQDQWQTPACTFYSAYHVINAYNILEDERQGQERPQIDPAIPRAEFCRWRWYSNSGYSIQWAANKAKKAGKIKWWATIPQYEPIESKIAKMKKALDMGYFINTGSSNGDWTKTKLERKYIVRTDGRFVWHARSIVDYDDEWFIALNSWWPYWCDKWYFHVPFDVVDKIYSALVIIDADDSWYFEKLKGKSKAMNLVRSLKSMYEFLPAKRQEISHNMADYLRTFYWFTDEEL